MTALRHNSTNPNRRHLYIKLNFRSINNDFYTTLAVLSWRNGVLVRKCVTNAAETSGARAAALQLIPIPSTAIVWLVSSTAAARSA